MNALAVIALAALGLGACLGKWWEHDRPDGVADLEDLVDNLEADNQMLTRRTARIFHGDAPVVPAAVRSRSGVVKAFLIGFAVMTGPTIAWHMRVVARRTPDHPSRPENTTQCPRAVAGADPGLDGPSWHAPREDHRP